MFYELMPNTLNHHKSIILVDDNLFFSTKVSSSLKQLGFVVEIEKSMENIRKRLSTQPEAVIINLSAISLDVMGIIKNLKNDAQTKHIPLVGFGGHKEREIFQAAREAGCDLVVTNNVISS